MAIKINGTDVIDKPGTSRRALNVGGVNGTYDDFYPYFNSISSPGTTVTIPLNQNFTSVIMNSNATVSASNILSGRTATVRLSNFSFYIPTFSSDFEFSPTEPTWTDHDYWFLNLICVNGSLVRVFAHGYD